MQESLKPFAAQLIVVRQGGVSILPWEINFIPPVIEAHGLLEFIQNCVP